MSERGDKSEPVRPRVEIVGMDGNAYSILGRCQAAARKAGWSKEQTEAFFREATSGDYDHLLRVVIKHFDAE